MLSRNVQRIHALACWTLIALGLAKALLALVDVFAPTFFAPRDPQVLADMRATRVAVGAWLGAEGMTVWSGHLGWNFSTALGLVFVGAVQLLLRRSNPLLLAATPIVPLATVLSLACAVIAATCWFWVPLLGFALATIGFAVTWYALRRVEAPARPPAADVRLLWLGALLMGFAGAVHGLATLPDIFADGALSPASPGVRRAMEETDLMLPAMFGASTSTWRAYLGFNLSHGLCVSCFALAAWLLARDLPGIVARDRALQALFVTASTLWFAVSLAFWFYGPVVWTAIAAACHLALLFRRPRILPSPGG
jgi:hypothetical protein